VDHIQKSSLGPLGQDILLLDEGDVYLPGDIRHPVLEPSSDLQILIDERSISDHSGIAAHIGYGLLLGRADLLELGLQAGRIGQVSHLDLLPGGLVHIGESYAPVGGAYLLRPGLLPQAVQLDVVGHDYGGLGIYADIKLDSLRLQGLDLIPEHAGIEDYSRAY